MKQIMMVLPKVEDPILLQNQTFKTPKFLRAIVLKPIGKRIVKVYIGQIHRKVRVYQLRIINGNNKMD